MKRTLIFLAIFIFGVLTGVLGNWLYFKHEMHKISEVGMGVLASSLYMYEANEADVQFNNPNKDIAIYALNRAVKNLEVFQEPNYYNSSCLTKAATLAKYNIRLAELYGEKNDEISRNTHLNKAIKQFEFFGWKFNKIEDIQNISTNNYLKDLEVAVHNNGKRVPSCLE